MSDDFDHSPYLRQVCAVALAGAALVVSLVAIVDPYRLYGVLDQRGFNHVKPLPERYREEIKLVGARSTRAQALITGNSRAEIGFDPEYAARTVGASFYNLSLAGTDIATAQRQLHYLRSHGQAPVAVVLGVEFLDFLARPPAPVHAPAAATAAHPVDGMLWRLDVLFSLASLQDSILTLRIQAAQDPESMTTLGFNPLLEYRQFARNQGYHALFRQRAMENAVSYVNKPRGLAFEQGAPGLATLRAVLDAAIEDNTQLDLVIYPYHAQILAMFEQAGLWPLFEQWKAALAQEVAAANRQSGKPRLTLWDFSGYSPYHCEPIPPAGSKAETRWYWEAGHFKQALGDLVLSRIYTPATVAATSPLLGQVLTPSTLAANQRRIAAERSACQLAYPGLFQEAEVLIAAASAGKAPRPAPSAAAGLFADTARYSERAN
jgi:hypothetical protein